MRRAFVVSWSWGPSPPLGVWYFEKASRKVCISLSILLYLIFQCYKIGKSNIVYISLSFFIDRFRSLSFFKVRSIKKLSKHSNSMTEKLKFI